jgi:hypothetical protein
VLLVLSVLAAFIFEGPRQMSTPGIVVAAALFSYSQNMANLGWAILVSIAVDSTLFFLVFWLGYIAGRWIWREIRIRQK